MNKELEEIVDSLLSKGDLTERSRELLMKKAEQLGVNLLDFELELEAKLAKQQSVTKESNKVGRIKKCPSCGASVPSFQTNCSECSHEFTGIQVRTSIADFLNQITKLTNKAASAEMWDGSQVKVTQAILNYPVPITREDILEFLTIGIPNSELSMKKGVVHFFKSIDSGYKLELMISRAWKKKCTECIIKARLAMKDDKTTLNEIEEYAKKLNI